MLSRTPYEIVTAVETVRTAEKRALIAVTRGLEREALLDPPRVLAATFQDARFVTPQTREVYAQLAEQGTDVRLHARGLQAWLAPGVRGVAVDDDEPVVDEWSLVMPCEQHPAVFVATDGVPGGADGALSYTWALSRDPDVVRACAHALGLHDVGPAVPDLVPGRRRRP
jgi:hypothetical protein